MFPCNCFIVFMPRKPLKSDVLFPCSSIPALYYLYALDLCFRPLKLVKVCARDFVSILLFSFRPLLLSFYSFFSFRLSKAM